MAYTKTNWQNSPSTATPLNATNLNHIETGLFDQDARITTVETDIDNLQNGWLPANETWTYVSVDDPTGNVLINGDLTTKYSPGMRIKFTNATNIIYGIITKVTYSSPNTTLTFLHEIDPTDSLAKVLMANSTITNNYYSNMKVPYGFPSNCESWTVYKKDASQRTQPSPTAMAWYNLGGVSINIPIGTWDISYSVMAQSAGSGDASTNRVFRTTLSSTNNSESDTEFTNSYGTVSAYLRAMSTKNLQKIIATKTTMYINTLSDVATTAIYNLNDASTLIIKAVCAYL